MADKFNFGDEVKEIITGFKGIVVARYSYMNGCVRYELKPRALKEGLPQEGKVYDQEQLTLVKAGVVKIVAHPTGGPRPTPTRPTPAPR
jgi:hypothetical protein